MAGDWIKMRSNLWDDPRVLRICDETETSEATVVGALYWLWATADQHSEDGVMPGLTLRSIDRKTGVQGFGAAMVSIGWLVDHPEGVRLVRFDEHNGESAKRRCVDAKRKANVRKPSDKCPTEDGQQAEVLREISELEKEKEKELQTTAEADAPTSRRKSDRRDETLAVFEYWQRTLNHPTCKLDATRIKAIKGRLADGYSVADLCEAVDGCKGDAWSQGANDRQTVYDDIARICKDGPKVDGFRAIAQRGNSSSGGYL